MVNRAAVVGVGNLLLRDDGIGIHAVRLLEKKYQIDQDKTAIVDAGTAGIYMAPVIETSSHIFVIDAVKLKAPPGTIKVFNEEELKAASVHTRMSPHQVGILEILELCRLRLEKPPQVKFITMVPKDISPGTELSPEITKNLPELVEIVKEELEHIGISVAEAPQNA